MDPRTSRRTWPGRVAVSWRAALAAFAVMAIAVTPMPANSARPADRLVRLEAGMDGFSPAQIAVNRGDRVTIELVSTDVVHGLYLDGYGLSVTADPGRPARLTFLADRPGAFQFRCSVTCGSQHPFLVGRLRVGSASLLWRAAATAGVLAIALLWPRR